MPNFPLNIWSGSECCEGCPDPANPCECESECGCDPLSTSFEDEITPGVLDDNVKEIYSNVSGSSCSALGDPAWCVEIFVPPRTFEDMLAASGTGEVWMMTEVDENGNVGCPDFPFPSWKQITGLIGNDENIFAVHNTDVELVDKTYIDPLTVVVENVGQTITYTEGTDYTVVGAYGNKIFINALSTGAIADGQELVITYNNGDYFKIEDFAACGTGDAAGDPILLAFDVNLGFSDDFFNFFDAAITQAAVDAGDVTYCGLFGWDNLGDCTNVNNWSCEEYCDFSYGADWDDATPFYECNESYFGVGIDEVGIFLDVLDLANDCPCGSNCQGFSDLCDTGCGNICYGPVSCETAEEWDVYEDFRFTFSGGTAGTPGYFNIDYPEIYWYGNNVFYTYEVDICGTTCTVLFGPDFLSSKDASLYDFPDIHVFNQITPNFTIDNSTCLGDVADLRTLTFTGATGAYELNAPQTNCLDLSTAVLGQPGSSTDPDLRVWVAAVWINGTRYTPSVSGGNNFVIPCCEDDAQAVAEVWVHAPVKAVNTNSCFCCVSELQTYTNVLFEEHVAFAITSDPSCP